MSSGLYTGGRERSTDGMIRGGVGEVGSDNKGYERLARVHTGTK